jgi:hypothetical protein
VEDLAICIDLHLVRHLMNEKFRQKYLVPHEKRSQDAPASATEPNANVVEGDTAFKQEDGPEDTGHSPQEVGASQPSNEPAKVPEPDIDKSIAAGDKLDSKSDAEPTGADPASDVASEIGTVADSDVDQADPFSWDFDIKVPEKFRYEVNFLPYHLTRVEELWQPEDRQGSAWEEYGVLRETFFQDDSVFFRSWSNLAQQIRWDWWWPSQALHCAARLGLSSLVERLIANGTDACKVDGEDTPLDFAIMYYAKAKENPVSNANCLRLFEILLRAGVDINMRGKDDEIKFLTFRFLLVQNPNIDAVQLFLKYGGDAKAINDGYCISVLHTCTQFSDKAEVLQAILSAGADPNAKDDDGETPLHNLMRRREVPEGFLQQLLDAKANVNEEDLASQREWQCHL